MGGEAFAKIGTPEQHGHAHPLRQRPRAEARATTNTKCGKITMGELLNEVCGGPLPGRTFKAVIPGGSSAKILRFGETFKLQEQGRHRVAHD